MIADGARELRGLNVSYKRTLNMTLSLTVSLTALMQCNAMMIRLSAASTTMRADARIGYATGARLWC